LYPKDSCLIFFLKETRNRNRSRRFPVAEHFNSSPHSLDDIMVCGLKQCSGSNISRKQHEMKLIFKLGTLRPNGLNINFLWLWL